MPLGAATATDVRSGIGRRAAIEMIPSAWYRPTRSLYWADLLVCASIGWASFTGLLQAGRGLRLLFFSVATFALYRAVLFIHELSHVNDSSLPYFELVWNVVIGVPFLVPSFLYRGVHLDHHRQKTYGTRSDPEYVPFAHRPPTTIGLYLLGALLLPVASMFRFGLLGPLSWTHAGIRKLTVERYSALAINRAYVRRDPPEGQWRLQELACTALCWTALLAWRTGSVPGRVFLWWGIVGATISALNAVRALAAHRYDNDGDELSSTEQLLDSCTLKRQSPSGMAPLVGAWQALWAPVGLRYHALHHWLPMLPYHNLGRAHRLLLTAIDEPAPYRSTLRDAMWATLADLVSRSLRRRA